MLFGVVGKMSVQGNVAGLVELGFADAAFSSPDPDEHDSKLTTLGATSPLRRSFRLSCFLAVKRLTDIIVAIALIALFSPLFVLIAILVRCSSYGPIIYTQNRLTEGGRIFKMLKFRTMRFEAEEASGPVWAAKCDPRVTPIGRFLRVSRLDELPQLVNVLRGEMSLIGPRPERPEIAAQLRRELPFFDRRMAVKGGITGLAQVSAGYASNLQTYREKLHLDLQYVKNRSIVLDIMIAIRTVVVVVTGYGAR